LSRVPTLVEDLLSKASTDLASVDDLYFTHLLSKGKQGSSFSLSSDAKDRLLKNLDRSTLEFKDEDEKKSGLSIQTLRALELLSSVGSSDKDADSAVSTAAQKLLKQATSLSQGETTPKTFVLSSTAKYHPDYFTNEDINLAVATHAGKTLNIDQQIGLRNYFQQRAQVAMSAH
jgi:poly-D-alanine transfer protein DltD